VNRVGGSRAPKREENRTEDTVGREGRRNWVMRNRKERREQREMKGGG